MPQGLAKAREFGHCLLTRAKLELAVVEDLMMPASVEFIPVRDARNRIVDLRCTFATASVAPLLREPVGELVGRHLSDIVGGVPGGRDLVAAYVSVAETGVSMQFESSRDETALPKCVEHAIQRPRQNCIRSRLRTPGLEERLRAARQRVAELESRGDL